MPVIGRLDEQVDAVLIKPLARTDEPDGDARARPEYQNMAQPQTATETTGETDLSSDKRALPEELPVWLL
jgi:hypothetical protein